MEMMLIGQLQFLTLEENDKILVSNNVSSGQESCEYLIGYLYDDQKFKPYIKLNLNFIYKVSKSKYICKMVMMDTH